MSAADTIFALSTARGRAAIAIIRLSGPLAGEALVRLTGRESMAPRTAIRARFTDPRSGEAIDDGLALWFPAPASVTGEDVVELHLHGGRAVLAAALEALARIDGLRGAEPGEFTRRAYFNGKIDLTAAEGLGDLIDAETAAQRRQALRQMAGGLETLYEGWRERLIRSLAHIEAEIDFSDEDLPGGLIARVRADTADLRREIIAHLDDRRRGEVLRDGLSVAILGAPNVGKSSLINALTRRQTAIVSSIAGTTRDIVEARLDLGGYPVLLADTAGIRLLDEDAPADPIEQEGIKRALVRAEQADLKLLVFDARTGPDAAIANLMDRNSVLIANKLDLVRDTASLPAGTIAVSAAADIGLEQLAARLAAEAEARMDTSQAPAVTRARHRSALNECAAALARAEQAGAIELVAEDMRLAVRALGRITGRVSVEDLLDVIFRDFCIGK